MEEIRELTPEELYQKKISDEFERLKNLPKEELVLTEEQIQAELEFATRQKRISELKQKLANYDYIGVKIATGRATKEEYAKEIAQMTEWANEINELEQCKAEVKEYLEGEANE